MPSDVAEALAKLAANDPALPGQLAKFGLSLPPAAETPTATSSGTDSFSVDLTEAVQATWRTLQTFRPEITDVVISIGPGQTRSKHKLGHLAPHRWMVKEDKTHELFLSGEHLKSGAEKVLMTVIHEGTHALAFARQVKDTSRYGRYHNDKFRSLAAELGLTVLKTVDGQKQRNGWTGDHDLTDTARTRHHDDLTRLDTILQGYRVAEQLTEKRKNRNGVSAECECEQPRKIRVHVQTYLTGPIICGLCQRPFTGDLPDQDNDEQITASS